MNAYGAIRRLLTVLLFLMGVTAVYAQNGVSYKDSPLYRRYQRAYQLRKSNEGVRMADSIAHEAAAQGDHRVELTAMTVPFLHEFYRSKNVAVVKAKAQQLMERAAKHEVWNVYYFTVGNLATYLVREGKYIEAVVFANEQKRFAEEHHHPIGIRTSYYIMGMVQHFRGEYEAAIRQFETYIDYSKKNLPQEDVVDAYLNICDCLRKSCQYKRMLDVVAEAEKNAHTSSEVYDVRAQRCYARFMTGDYQGFLADYNYLQSHPRAKTGLRNIVQTAIQVGKYICDGKNDEARKLIDDLSKKSSFESQRLMIAYHKYNRNYAEAIQMQWTLVSDFYQHMETMVDNDNKSVKNMTDVQQKEEERRRLDYENTQMAIANTQLSLSNSSLELGHSKDAARLAQMLADRNQLDFQNQQLESKKLQLSISQQAQQQQEEERHMAAQKRGLTWFFFVIVAVLALTLFYVMVRRRQSRQLHDNIHQLHDTILRLNDARIKAQESEMMKTRFVQNMSHEIRTPLNAIVGFSNVLVTMGDELTPHERDELTRYISTNSNLLTTLVNDILDLTTLQSRSYEMQMETVAVNEMCHETIETVRHRLAPGVELRYETEVDDAFTAQTDHKRVQQVLINLLTNAEKNTTKGSITLNCKKDPRPNMVTFVVTDTGIGVPPEKMEEIFQRFRKLDQAKQGSGLGLDICRTIADKLHGEINIDRQYTTGARFIFTIPYRS